MTSEELLQKLEQGDLAPAEVVASLRRQLAAAKQPIAPSAITKLLVDKGHLTAGQAQRLLDAGGATNGAAKAAAPVAATTSAIQKAAPAKPIAPKPVVAKAPVAPAASNSSVLDDLGLAPLDDLPETPAPAAKASAAAVATKPAAAKSAIAKTPAAPAPAASSSSLDDLGLAPLDDLPELPATKPNTPAPANKAVAAPAKPAAAAPKVTPLALDDLGLAPLDDLPVAPAAPVPNQPAAKAPAKPATTKPAAQPAAVAKTAPATKPATAAKPVATTPAPLDDLASLDDLGSGGLDPLDGLATLDDLSPLGATDLSTAGGFDPLGGPADIATLSSPLATPAKPQATAAAVAARTAAAAAVESRQTTWVAIGIGGVALLVIVVGLAIFLWPRGNGAVEFAAAEQSYQEKQYATAIEKYDQLLRAFPRHDQASLVKVHRSMAAIHANASQPAGLLSTVQQEAKALAPESAVTQVHAELAPLLLQLTEQLAGQAMQAKTADEAKAAATSAQEALALCNDARLLPANLRPWQKLAELEENLQLVARTEQRLSASERAQQAITTQLASGNIAAALATGNELLLAFPEASGDGLWQKIAPALADAASKAVKTSAEKRSAATTAVNTPVVAAFPWQSLLAEPVIAQPGPTVIVVAAGAVYALEEATGAIRWSRYLGCATDIIPPQSTDKRSVYLTDVATRELLQADTQTGKVLWRQSLPATPVGAPLLVADKVYVSLNNGTLLCHEGSTGEVLAQAELPQALSIGVQVSTDGKQLLQVADEALIYLLNPADLKCERAHYLGHAARSITVAPLSFRDRWLICESTGSDKANLHSVSVGGSSIEHKLQRIDGGVAASPILLGERVLLSSSRGKLLLLEDNADEPEPFKIVGTVNATSEELLTRQIVAHAGGVLCADQGLALLKFDAQRQLQPAWSAVTNAYFDGHPQIVNQSAIAVHHDATQGITWATAVNAADGVAKWQVPLTMPVGLIASEPGKPVVLPWQQVPATASASTSPAIAPVAKLGWLPAGSQWLLTTIGKTELTLIDKSGTSRVLPLPGALAGTPALCGKHLLVPLADGSVVSLDPQTGKPTTAPMIVPANRSASSLPAAVIPLNEAGTQVLVFNGSNLLVTFQFSPQPQPDWTEVSSTVIPESLIAAPVAAGANVFGYDQSGNLRLYSLPDLQVGQVSNAVGRRVTFGPHVVPDGVLLATSYDELLCLQADGSRRWSQPLTRGKPIGKPIIQEANVVLVSQGGMIEVRALATGELVQSVDCSQPLQGLPLLVDNTLWVPALNGQILQVSLAREQAQP
ncbi:PQQ-binding-like beta-propeller repeat protein [Anatilimnocola sp. NA78]|uniref:outer membrane protein assembly factor BamB family protein n=1 Tax=Anatilimnocola sp. NA78 TaxID=3415683 RepID=UPI003CE5672D